MAGSKKDYICSRDPVGYVGIVCMLPWIRYPWFIPKFFWRLHKLMASHFFDTRVSRQSLLAAKHHTWQGVRSNSMIFCRPPSCFVVSIVWMWLHLWEISVSSINDWICVTLMPLGSQEFWVSCASHTWFQTQLAVKYSCCGVPYILAVDCETSHLSHFSKNESLALKLRYFNKIQNAVLIISQET